MKVGFVTTNVVYIDLNENYQITYENSGFLKNLNISSDKTYWTMVYDEGFDITIGNHNFFLFSKYEPSGKNENGTKTYTSICGETLVGWY